MPLDRLPHRPRMRREEERGEVDPICRQRKLSSHSSPVGEVGRSLGALDPAQSDRAGGEASPCQESTPCELTSVHAFIVTRGRSLC